MDRRAIEEISAKGSERTGEVLCTRDHLPIKKMRPASPDLKDFQGSDTTPQFS